MEGFPASDWLTEGRRATPAEVEVERERTNAALLRFAVVMMMEDPHDSTAMADDSQWAAESAQEDAQWSEFLDAEESQMR